jgi:hypothetical protein
MRIDEISTVDRPAQPGARMSIMKRAAAALGLKPKPKKGEPGYVAEKAAPKSADDDEALESEDEGTDGGGKPKKKKGKAKNPFAAATKRALLTTPMDGHQHLLSDEVGPDARTSAGTTSHDRGTNTDFHSHPWMIEASSGAVVIGEAEGHTHQVLLTSQSGSPPAILDLSKQATAGAPDPTAASTSSGVPADSVGTVHNEATMSKENDQTVDNEAVAKQLVEITKRAERAESVSELNDAQRGIFKSLDAEGQDAFLALTPEQRIAEVAKAADANAVVHTDLDGVEYRKSDDPRLVQLAKRADGERTARLAGEVVAKAADLRKRAEGLVGIPGTIEVRMSILKGIDMLPEADQAPALEALQAQDAGLAEAFKRQGTAAVPSTVNELDTIAKKIRDADPSLSPEQAMAKALETPEGSEAYSKSLTF